MERDEALRQRVARNVKRLRLAKAWTQDDLAARVGNSNRHVSQIERGVANLTLDYVAKIAASLSADAAELFFNDQPPPEQPPGAVAVFVSPDDLKLLEQARRVLARAQEVARPVASPSEPTTRSTSEPPDDR